MLFLRSFILCFFLFAFSGCSFFDVDISSKASPTRSQQVSEEVHILSSEVKIPDQTIVYSESGYTPKIITVARGTTVHFVNESDLPLWTASDPHPVHNDFSEFDSKKAISRGEEYTFFFNKTGTFGYHNHKKSLHRGVIRVYDPSAPTVTIDKTLPGSLETRDKLLKILTEDPESIQKLFNTILGNKKLANDCHDIAHDLGHRAYELFGFSGALLYNTTNKETVAYVDDICAGGYMHGVLEELFLHDPTLLSHPDVACQGMQPSNRESCFHGVGHGIMFGFERDLPKSIEACRGMKQVFAQHRCYEGVYMELFWGQTTHAKKALGWDISDPLSACANTDAETSPSCFLYGHLGYLRTHKGDFFGAIHLCRESKLSQYQKSYCIKGIGITLMKRFSSHHLDEIENFTYSLSDYEKKSLYDGVIGYSLLSSVPRASLDQICHKMKRDADICLTSLSEAL